LAGFGLVHSFFRCGHGVIPSVWGFGGASGRNPGLPARMGGRDRVDPHSGSARRLAGAVVYWGSRVASTGLRIPLLTSENVFQSHRDAKISCGESFRRPERRPAAAPGMPVGRR
jgi:hypothetical protein